jgi:hypothetical protein
MRPLEETPMRPIIALLAAAVFCASAVNAEVGQERRVVYLNGPEAMAELEKTNPKHYAIARQILAAGPQLCEAAGQRVYQATMGAEEITCSSFLLRTSNPPKKQISFELEDATYIALIEVKVDASITPAR